MDYGAFQNCYAFQWIPYQLFMSGFAHQNPQIFARACRQIHKQNSADHDASILGFKANSAFSLCQQSLQNLQKTIQHDAQNSNVDLQSSDQKIKQSVSSKINQQLEKSEKRSKLVFDQQSQYSQFKIKKRYSRKENISKAQKEGRNKFSNILRCFLKYVSNKGLSLANINQIIFRRRLNITPEQFHNWMRKKSLDFRNYIRPKAIKQLFLQVDIFPDYNILIRILFQHFMRNLYHVHLLSSAKMTKKSWIMHLEGARQVFDQILIQK